MGPSRSTQAGATDRSSTVDGTPLLETDVELHALEARGLGKRYGRNRWGLRNISVAIPVGSVTALGRSERCREVNAATHMDRFRATDRRGGARPRA